MNKIVITMISIIVVMFSIITAIIIFKSESSNEDKYIVTKVAEEEILDECTDEYEELEREDMIQANSEEEKVSPYCSFTIKTYYKECGHTKNEYLKLMNFIAKIDPSAFVTVYAVHEMRYVPKQKATK